MAVHNLDVDLFPKFDFSVGAGHGHRHRIIV
jgi:hypothetical protein